MQPARAALAGTLAALAAAVLLLAASGSTALAWGVNHPDQCLPCHGPVSIYNETVSYNETWYNVTQAGPVYWKDVTVKLWNFYYWNHTVHLERRTGVSAWQFCTQCHSNYVAGTVHENIGCRCHAVLHLGYNAAGEFFGVVVYNEVSPAALNVTAPSAASIVSGRLAFTDENVTLKANLNTFVSALLSSEPKGMEVEVGLWDPFENDYYPVDAQLVQGEGGGLDREALRVCFGCHFLATDPSQVGAYAIVEGKVKIGIPELALKLPPHEIYEVSPGRYYGGAEATPVAPTVAAALAGVLGVLMLAGGVRVREG